MQHVNYSLLGFPPFFLKGVLKSLLSYCNTTQDSMLLHFQVPSRLWGLLHISHPLDFTLVCTYIVNFFTSITCYIVITLFCTWITCNIIHCDYETSITRVSRLLAHQCSHSSPTIDGSSAPWITLYHRLSYIACSTLNWIILHFITLHLMFCFTLQGHFLYFDVHT